MAIHHFQLRSEFIELNVLLKLLGLAPSGGAAKAMVADGAVAVDGAIETRTRRKLRPGQRVRVADEEIHIVGDAAQQPPGDPAGNLEPRKRRTAVARSPGEEAGSKVRR